MFTILYDSLNTLDQSQTFRAMAATVDYYWIPTETRRQLFPYNLWLERHLWSLHQFHQLLGDTKTVLCAQFTDILDIPGQNNGTYTENNKQFFDCYKIWNNSSLVERHIRYQTKNQKNYSFSVYELWLSRPVFWNSPKVWADAKALVMAQLEEANLFPVIEAYSGLRSLDIQTKPTFRGEWKNASIQRCWSNCISRKQLTQSDVIAEASIDTIWCHVNSHGHQKWLVLG